MSGQMFVDDGNGVQLRLKGTDRGDGTATIDVSGMGATPTAAPITDTDPNPTTTSVASRLTAWTGAVWERVKSVGGAIFVAEQYAPLYEDATNGVAAGAQKPVIDPTYSTTTLFPITSGVAVARAKTSACLITGFTLSNNSASVVYAQLHDTNATPTVGAVPIVSLPVSAGTTIVQGSPLTQNGRYCANGAYVVASITESTYSAATPADHSIQIWGV